MTSSKPRSPLTRLLTASVLSLALLGGITACASTESPAQPQAGNTVAPTTAAPTAKVEVDPSIPDNRGVISGHVTKVISGQVVEFTPARSGVNSTDLTGDELSFPVLIDDTTPDPSYTCDEEARIKAMERETAQVPWVEFYDTADGQLSNENQRQGTIRVASAAHPLAMTSMAYCVPANK